MEVTLIASRFKQGGSGIPRYSYNIYSGLKSRYKVKRWGVLENNIINVPPAFQFVNKELIFALNTRQLKGRNVHVLEHGLLPARYLKLPKKKIVTIHDFFNVFDTEFSVYPKEATLWKRALFTPIWKLSVLWTRKIYQAVNKYDHVVLVSELAKEDAINKFKVDKNKISVIYPIVEDKFKSLKVRSRFHEHPIIGYINSFGYNKREKLRVFIEKFKKIKDKQLSFHIYGRGFTFGNLIKDDPRIKYFGFLPESELVNTTNNFDVYLSTSTAEGFGSPIMQAKACKVPVLCYDGKLPKIIKRNTILWNDENLSDLLLKRAWEKSNLNAAFNDTKKCRKAYVINQFIDLYKKVF